jgi:hypothetical protein
MMGFLHGAGPGLLAANPRHEEDRQTCEDQFKVEVRIVASGARMIVIGMPSTGAPNEASSLGMYVPASDDGPTRPSCRRR